MVTRSAPLAAVARRRVAPPIAQAGMTVVTKAVSTVGDHPAVAWAIAAQLDGGRARLLDARCRLDGGLAKGCRVRAQDRENDPRASPLGKADEYRRARRAENRIVDIRPC